MSDFNSLQAVADRQAIADLIYRYCRAVDRLDHELGYSIWHADGTADYGAYYQGSGRGVIDLICANHLRLQCHSHQVSNIVVELDGDRAASEAYVTANLRMARDGVIQQMSVWSRYVDQWSRRNGRWGIDKRIAIRDFDEIRAVTPLTQLSEGGRDRGDPSYTALRASA
jgi:hypothetical protein